MTGKPMSLQDTLFDRQNRLDLAALLLRTGLGLVFVIGGWNKLYQLLDPVLQGAILESYLGPTGYVNAFFKDYLFEGGHLSGIFTPWSFLTTLSAFELISGLLLIFGVLTRPLALIYAILVWLFVIALPVITVDGAAAEISTYRSPAMLVQIRDIGLSAMMVVLFNLGPGRFSLTQKFRPGAEIKNGANWQNLGLLLRLGVAVPLIIGGAFWGMDHIPDFHAPWFVLLVLGLFLGFGIAPRVFAALTAGLMIYYMGTKINLDSSLIANLNGIKREFAFLAAAAVLFLAGPGKQLTRFARGPLTAKPDA